MRFDTHSTRWSAGPITVVLLCAALSAGAADKIQVYRVPKETAASLSSGHSAGDGHNHGPGDGHDHGTMGNPHGVRATPKVTYTTPEGWREAGAGFQPTKRIAFLGGFPRSGTTLIEQMLDAHPALQAMDERPHFDVLADQLEDYGVHVPRGLGRLTQADCDELRKGYMLMACARTPRRRDAQLVDKNPLNMLWLPLIQRVFPNARFILMLRNPCDALLSNYMQDYRSVVMMSISLDLERLARAYVEAFEYWFHHAAILQPKVLTVRYEDLVAAPERAAAAMGGFLGLADASPMLNFARHAREKGFIGTPSYTQVIEPINQLGVDRWLHYRRWFGKPLEILAPILARLGYPGGGEV